MRYYTVTMNERFDHDKLTVYQDAIRFVVWAGDLLETLPKSLAAYDQLDRGKRYGRVLSRCWWA
jgi:hypothetical protein